MDTQTQYVTFSVGGQEFGLDVGNVRDILNPQRMTPVPRSRPEVAGVLNLRGRIVTVIDLRRRLGLPAAEEGAQRMNIVVEYKGEPYSLVVDAVGDVMTLDQETWEANPPTLDPAWKAVSLGVHRLDGRLLVIFDLTKVMAFIG